MRPMITDPREELLLLLSALDDACVSPETLRRQRQRATRKALAKELRQSLPYTEPEIDESQERVCFSD